MKKRFIAFLLVIAMVLTAIPIWAVSALTPQPRTGTIASGPFTITNFVESACLSRVQNPYFIGEGTVYFANAPATITVQRDILLSSDESKFYYGLNGAYPIRRVHLPDGMDFWEYRNILGTDADEAYRNRGYFVATILSFPGRYTSIDYFGDGYYFEALPAGSTLVLTEGVYRLTFWGSSLRVDYIVVGSGTAEGTPQPSRPPVQSVEAIPGIIRYSFSPAGQISGQFPMQYGSIVLSNINNVADSLLPNINRVVDMVDVAVGTELSMEIVVPPSVLNEPSVSISFGTLGESQQWTLSDVQNNRLGVIQPLPIAFARAVIGDGDFEHAEAMNFTYTHRGTGQSIGYDEPRLTITLDTPGVFTLSWSMIELQEQIYFGAVWVNVVDGGEGDVAAQPTPTPGTGFTTTPMVAAGSSHAVTLKNDGTVWGWARDRRAGMTIANTRVDELHIPRQVRNLNNITSISAGWMHTSALRDDGTVWSFGYNYYGQLGDGTRASSVSSAARQAQGLTNVTAISAGGSHTVALRDDGTAWAWGRNRSGELGDGTTTMRTTPVQVQGLSNIASIATGSSYTIALRNDGTVWAWGSNQYGRLGNDNINTWSHTHTPRQVQELSNVTAISASWNHALALKDDGTVWAWGNNSNGQLGHDTAASNIRPVQVQGITDVIAISAGLAHSIALRSDGTVWAWGRNSDWQLGNNSSTDSAVPVQVQNLNGITAISTRVSHSLALRYDGYVWAWGTISGLTTNLPVPSQVVGENGVGFLNLGASAASPTPAPATPSPTPQPYTFLQSAANFIRDNGHRLYRPIINGSTYYVYELRNSIARYDDGRFFIEQWEINTVYLIGTDADRRRSLVLDFTTLQQAGFLHNTNTLRHDGIYTNAELSRFIREILYTPDGTDAQSLTERAWMLYDVGNFFVGTGEFFAGMGKMLADALIFKDFSAPVSFILPIVVDMVVEQMDVRVPTLELLRYIRTAYGVGLLADLNSAQRITLPANHENGFIRNYQDAVALRATRYSRAVFLEYLAMELRYLEEAIDTAMTAAKISLFFIAADWFIAARDIDSTILDVYITFMPTTIGAITTLQASHATMRDPALRAMLQNIENAFSAKMYAQHNPFHAVWFHNYNLIFGEYEETLWDMFDTFGLMYEDIGHQMWANASVGARDRVELTRSFSNTINSMFTSLHGIGAQAPQQSGQNHAQNLTTASNWARGDISTATALGLVPQNLQNNYTSNITRAEFAALAVALYEAVTGQEIAGRVTFNDTNDINVQKAAYIGIIAGVGGNRFNPAGTLNREQAAVLIYRLVETISTPLPAARPVFSDNARISTWAFQGVGAVQASGIMGGTGHGNFSPRGTFTREQSIITMLRLYEYLEPLTINVPGSSMPEDATPSTDTSSADTPGINAPGTNAPTSNIGERANISDGIYLIRARGSSLFVDVQYGHLGNGTRLWLWFRNETLPQQWQFQRQPDGSYRIQAMHSGRVMEVRNSSHQNGAEVAQWDDAGIATQRWFIYDAGDGYISFVNANSGKALDVSSQNPQQHDFLQQYQRNNTQAQQFMLIPFTP